MISNTALVANGWGVTDIVTSVECDISRPGREILTAYCQEDARCSQDLRSSCRNRSSADLPRLGNERLAEELHVAHPIESKEAEVLTQFAPGAGEPGRRIKP